MRKQGRLAPLKLVAIKEDELMEEEAMLMWSIWDLPHSVLFGFIWVAMSGFAAADGQVQIEMQMMCQTGALARNRWELGIH